MKYSKQALSFEDQADRLLARGVSADREELIQRLVAVSYYRLSGYLYPFREDESSNFIDGTSLQTVWNRYCFDRRLRVLFLDAIERVEVAVRTQLVAHFSHSQGPFGYCSEENLPGLKVAEYLEWRESLRIETSRSKEAFKTHFFKKYDERNLPIWMVAELMSMGSMLTFYKGVDNKIASQVAEHFGMPGEQLLTWLRSLYAARNICAHHSRLWNRALGYAPGLPQKNKHPNWHQKDGDGKPLLTNNRTGILLMICRSFLSQISSTSQWHLRIEALFSEYPEIPVREMGLPNNWQQHPLWKI